MKVDLTAISPDTVMFEDLETGKSFLFGGHLYIKSQTVLQGGRFFATGGEVTFFGVAIESGVATSFAPETRVVPVDATVRLVRILPVA